jgi:hypothetical protein
MTNDLGIFGQPVILSSGIGRQNPLFHEPLTFKPSPPKPIGSAEANRPEHTTEMFPDVPAGCHSRADLEVASLRDLQRIAVAFRLESADCIGGEGRNNLIDRIIEAQGL